MRPKVLLEQDVVEAVLEGEAERLLHRAVTEKRNTVYGHSDAIAHEIRGWNYSGSTVRFYKFAFKPLTKDETRMLRGMVRKWISHIEELRSRSKQSIRSGQKVVSSFSAKL